MDRSVHRHHVDDVVAAAGFGPAAAMRHHFRARLWTSPSAYRGAFVSPSR